MESKNIIKSIFIVVLIFANISVNATTYYVALTGNNGNTGSENSPFREISYGISVLIPGDTLIIKTGDYGNENNIEFPTSGTEINPITLMAEMAGTVILRGTRLPEEIDGGGTGFAMYGVSYINILGIHFIDYEIAIDIDGELSNGNINIQNCIFENNGDSGITIWEVNTIKVHNCQFITSVPVSGWPDPNEPDAIQDYGVAVYFSDSALIENNFFFGPHNQALSYKEGCTNGTAKRNIFEGSLYTAIYLGQNKRADGKEKCTNLTAEYNIVRRAIGEYNYIKSPIRVDNVENAIVKRNYIESFDFTNNTSGINIWNEALGNIEVHDNIIAFSVDNVNSGGIDIQEGIPESVAISITYNTIYDVVQDWFGELDSANNQVYQNNISYLCNYNNGELPDNFYGDPLFINGNPLIQEEATDPTTYNFNDYYTQLIDPFRIVNGSDAEAYGYRFDGIVPSANEFNDEEIIILFPNPTDDYFSIYTDEIIESISIYNQLGQKVFEKKFIANKINISQLDAGIYFVLLRSNTKFINKKLIVK